LVPATVRQLLAQAMWPVGRTLAALVAVRLIWPAAFGNSLYSVPVGAVLALLLCWFGMLSGGDRSVVLGLLAPWRQAGGDLRGERQ
jgi:hypothetical protein